MTRHRGRIAPIKLILPGLNPHPASALLAGRDVAGPQRPRMGDGGLPAKIGDGSPAKGANPNGQGKGRQLCNTNDNRKRQRQSVGRATPRAEAAAPRAERARPGSAVPALGASEGPCRLQGPAGQEQRRPLPPRHYPRHTAASAGPGVVS